MGKTLPFIGSPDNPKVKSLVRLKDGKGALFLVEGKHLVEEAHRHGSLLEIYSTYEPPYPETKRTLLSERAYKKVTSLVHPEGILGVCERKKEVPFSSGRVLVLDGVGDPGNLGTILRTALAFSYFDVVFLPGTATPYSSKALMASQGAIFQLSLHFLMRKEAADALKKDGYFLLASDLSSSLPPSSFLLKEKLALVLGSESHGISDEIRSLSDARVRIEMGNIDSLNVGVAGGILMYELRKKLA